MRGLTKNNVLLHKSADTVASCCKEEPLGSMKENEAQTIKNIFPDEDDLFSGVIDGLECTDAKRGDDTEDFDLFSSVGGMELEVDDVSCAGKNDSNIAGVVPNGQGSSVGSIARIHETPHKFHLKFIEFYDVRAAEAARCALNKCNIVGKQINLGPSSPGGARQWSRTVGCYDNGYVQALHSASHMPLSGLTKNALSHGSSCVPNSLPSPLRVASAVNHFGFHKSHHSVDQVKSKCIPSFHPYSFPDCQDNFNISVPYKSSSTVANMAGKFGSSVRWNEWQAHKYDGFKWAANGT
ncbi:unnamed protein product [Camellia sinensis]